MTIPCWLGLERTYEPGDNYLFEYDGIRPYLDLPPLVATLGIDPCCVRNHPAIEKLIDIRDGDLRVAVPRQDEHRRHRLSLQSWVGELHLRQDLVLLRS